MQKDLLDAAALPESLEPVAQPVHAIRIQLLDQITESLSQVSKAEPDVRALVDKLDVTVCP